MTRTEKIRPLLVPVYPKELFVAVKLPASTEKAVIEAA